MKITFTAATIWKGRIKFTAATTTTKTRIKYTTKRAGNLSKVTTISQRTTSAAAWASPWKGKKESWSRRRAKEVTKGSSRASWSQADDLKNVESRRKLERTAGWAGSVAEKAVSNRPLSKVVIEPLRNVTQDRDENRFSYYPKTKPLF